MRILSDMFEPDNLKVDTLSANKSRVFHPVPRITRTYVCPRGIEFHHGAKEKCGKACEKAQGTHPDEYLSHWDMTFRATEKEIVFDENACRVEQDHSSA